MFNLGIQSPFPMFLLATLVALAYSLQFKNNKEITIEPCPKLYSVGIPLTNEVHVHNRRSEHM